MSAFLGHAVDRETRKIRFLSVSAISKFDPREDFGCPRVWWFHFVAGIKEPMDPDGPAARGVAYAKEIEHYLKTGEDALSPVTRAGKFLLPAPGPDLEVEQPLGDLVAAIATGNPDLAGLVAAGVPLTGAADLRHRRGEYVDYDCSLRREETPGVVEICDHKTTRQIDDARSKSGKKTYGRGKTPEQVLAQTQMIGYGVHAKAPWVRLGHIYYQTEGETKASKRHGLISAEELIRRWERVEGVVREMKDVARETDVARVPPNLTVCYKRKQNPCFYLDQCPRTDEQVLVSLSARVHPLLSGEPRMSLFNQVKKSQAVPAPTPPPNGVTLAVPDRAAIDVEKQKLLAEAARLGGAGAEPPSRSCGAPGCGDGCAPGWVKSGQGFVNCSCRGAGIAKVNPPDAPAPKPTDIADPVAPEALQGVDPEIQARAAALAEGSPTPTVTVEKTSGRCPGGNVRIVLTTDQVLAREITCGTCKKPVKVKPAKTGDNTYEATVPGHNLPKPEAPAAPAATTALPGQTVIPGTGVQEVPTWVVVDAKEAARAVEIINSTVAPTIFLDTVVIGGTQPKPLRDYYGPIVEAIEKQAGASDLRCAPDGDLSHGRWRGVLAALVKARPLPPGEYSASSHDDVEMVVVTAIRGARIVRGVR